MEIYLSAALGLSVLGNAYFYYLHRKSKKSRPLSVSAQELLGQFVTGRALLHIRVIDPADMLLISPRDRS